MQKVIKTIIAAGAAAMMLTACSTSATPAATSAAPSASTSSEAPKLKVGMAYDVGGRGDQSFNDSRRRWPGQGCR